MLSSWSAQIFVSPNSLVSYEWEIALLQMKWKDNKRELEWKSFSLFAGSILGKYEKIYVTMISKYRHVSTETWTIAPKTI